MNQLAIKLIKIENELNEVHGKKLPLGSFLVRYLRYIKLRENNRYNFINTLKENCSGLIFLYRFFLVATKKKNTYNFENQKIILGKSGNVKHYNKLLDYIYEDYFPQAHLCDMTYEQYYSALSIIEKIKIFSKTVKVIRKSYPLICVKFSKTGIVYSPIKLINNLFIQCTRFFVLQNLLKSFPFIQFVLVDYDRNKYVPLILAANSLGIKTISLQHGVINPPYGYNPLIANEIWVWGNIWKQRLVALNVSQERIKIVGSPIVEDFSSRLSSNKIKVIGIGPNPIGNPGNLKLWGNLIPELVKCGYEVTVKLHPSMKRIDNLKIFGNEAKIYEARELSNESFLDQIDLIMVSNSGLGYEAVLSNVLVTVLRQSCDSQGNDYIMITEGGFPEIKLNSNLSECLSNIAKNYSEILEAEKEFVRKEVYQRIGLKAKEETKKLIDFNLQSTNQKLIQQQEILERQMN